MCKRLKGISLGTARWRKNWAEREKNLRDFKDAKNMENENLSPILPKTAKMYFPFLMREICVDTIQKEIEHEWVRDEQRCMHFKMWISPRNNDRRKQRNRSSIFCVLKATNRWSVTTTAPTHTYTHTYIHTTHIWCKCKYTRTHLLQKEVQNKHQQKEVVSIMMMMMRSSSSSEIPFSWFWLISVKK